MRLCISMLRCAVAMVGTCKVFRIQSHQNMHAMNKATPRYLLLVVQLFTSLTVVCAAQVCGAHRGPLQISFSLCTTPHIVVVDATSDFEVSEYRNSPVRRLYVFDKLLSAACVTASIQPPPPLPDIAVLPHIADTRGYLHSLSSSSFGIGRVARAAELIRPGTSVAQSCALEARLRAKTQVGWTRSPYWIL